MELEFDYDLIAVDKQQRARFFKGYQKLIRELKKDGWTDCALAHAKNKKRLMEELEMLDMI